MPPTSKKLKGQIGLGLFVCLSIYIFFQTWILVKKKNHTSHTPNPTPPLPPTRIFFLVRFGYFIKNPLSGFIVKENFTYPSPPPPPPRSPTEKIIHLCNVLWILVQSDTVNGLILFGGRCDLYIMVQRLCLVSLTISNRKTSYRSLK